MPLVRLTEVCTNTTLTTSQNYLLREVFVNPEHVVMIREEKRIKQLHERGELHAELDPGHTFSKLTINRGHTGTEIVVVGAPDIVEKTLTKNKKQQLIRG
jgi:hypothetical protein